MQLTDMKGKAALVTGVAGDLGRTTALRLARAGADVCLVDFDRQSLEGPATEARSLGVRAYVRPSDVTDRDACFAAVADAVQAFGRLDALCNVANAFLPSQATKTPKRDWELTLAINLSAPFYLTQAALPHLLETDGAVVNVTSCVAFMAHPYTAAYTASKAGLVQMTKALAAEYIGQKIRINLVSPGSMSVSSGSTASIPPDLDPELFQKYSTVRGRIEADEVAEVIAFLASGAARRFHGACIAIDNGISLG
jgi:NAD(P)-dependent dehydrogenase (short-subunit alcohol dehydrogenase family)